MTEGKTRGERLEWRLELAEGALAAQLEKHTRANREVIRCIVECRPARELEAAQMHRAHLDNVTLEAGTYALECREGLELFRNGAS